MGTNLNISATIGKLVYTNITNDGSNDIDTDFAWLFTDGGAPINLSQGIDGYSPNTIFPGETFELIYDVSNVTATRIAVTIDGITKASRVI